MTRNILITFLVLANLTVGLFLFHAPPISVCFTYEGAIGSWCAQYTPPFKRTIESRPNA